MFRLLPVLGPEPQTVIKLFMQVVFKQLINPNVMALPGVSSSCYRDFPRVCQLLSLCSHCRVCSACETESEKQKRTKLGFILEFTEKPKDSVTCFPSSETVSDKAALNRMFTFCYLK